LLHRKIGGIGNDAGTTAAPFTTRQRGSVRLVLIILELKNQIVNYSGTMESSPATGASALVVLHLPPKCSPKSCDQCAVRRSLAPLPDSVSNRNGTGQSWGLQRWKKSRWSGVRGNLNEWLGGMRDRIERRSPPW